MAESSRMTLTDATYVGRQMVKFAVIFLVVLIVGRTLWGAVAAYWKATHPEPPPPPTAGFGILPPLRFPDKAATDKPTSYLLQTPQGTLPDFGDRAKVFFMPPSSMSLLADEEAKKVAASYDFIFEPEVLSSRIYRWRKSQPLESTLQYDIQSHQFKFTSNYLSRPDLLSSSQLPDNFAAVDNVKSFLRKSDMLPKDVATASGEIVYLKAIGTELQEAFSLSDADYLQVDLNRDPVDGIYRMYTPNGLMGSISAIIGGNFKGADSIYQLSYNYHPVDYSQVETYPIRSAADAWQLVQAGEGFVAQKGEDDTAVVRRVYLAYYDDYEEQEYLQPIYVFEGDKGFLGYAPAVDPHYIQTQIAQ